MKKYFCLLLLVAMCMSFVACNNEYSGLRYLSGDQIRHDVFTYSINPDGKTCTITGFDSDNPTWRIHSRVPTWSINVVIPDKIFGYTVTEIAPNAFNESTQIETVRIPDTIIKIGENAFVNCSSLTTVVFEEPQNWGDLAETLGNPETAAEFLVNLTESIHR